MRHQFFAALVFILGVCRRSRQLRLAGLALLAALAVSQPVFAQSVPEVIEYYATDHLGSIRVVFDPNGTVLARSDYLPFGETYAQSGSLPPQRFTGQEHDDETGLEYFNARSLLARTGRFNRPDPLFAGAMGNPQGWNRYAYVGNNPLRFTDPTGAAASKSPGNGINLWDDTECSAEHSLAQCGGMGAFWSSPADPGGGGLPAGFGDNYAWAVAMGYQPGMPLDLWHSMVEWDTRATIAFDQAQKASAEAKMTFAAAPTTEEVQMMAAEAYAEQTDGSFAQYAAMVSTVMNRYSIGIASGRSKTTVTSVLNTPNAYQAMYSRNYNAAISAFGTGSASAQMNLALQAAQHVVTNGTTTNASGFTHLPVTRPSGQWLPATPPSIGNLMLWTDASGSR